MLRVCNGNGYKPTFASIDIDIPRSLDNGDFLRVPNAGDYQNSVGVGDLVIQIEVVPKDGFEKFNNDLIYNLFLNLEDLNKDKYNIPHPDGELRIDSPKIFDSSKPLRLRSKGYNGGDMYVKLNVKFERTN